MLSAIQIAKFLDLAKDILIESQGSKAIPDIEDVSILSNFDLESSKILLIVSNRRLVWFICVKGWADLLYNYTYTYLSPQNIKYVISFQGDGSERITRINE